MKTISQLHTAGRHTKPSVVREIRGGTVRLSDRAQPGGLARDLVGNRWTSSMALLLALALIAGFLPLLSPMQKVYAAVEPGKVAFSVTQSAGVWSLANVEIGAVPAPSTSYYSLNITYPGVFDFHYSLPSGWVVKSNMPSIDGSSVSLNIDVSANGGSATVQAFLADQANTNFTEIVSGVCPAAGSTITIMLTETTMAGRMDDEGNMHVYEFVSTGSSPVSWMRAYNLAQGRTYNGKSGYLATLTCIDEQMYVYQSISTHPGWLGGTRLLNADRSRIGATAPISENIFDYVKDPSIATTWYWTAGPEAGLVFYNTPRYDAVNGAVPDVFNFFSNATTKAAYPAYQSYITVPTPNQQPDASSGTVGVSFTFENCLQFALDNYASWNDLDATFTNTVYVQGYFVEYGPYTLDEYAVNKAAASEPVPIRQTVSFDVNNAAATAVGVTAADQTVWTGDTATAPTVLVAGQLYPAYGNQKFLGWFESLTATTAFDFLTPITTANSTVASDGTVSKTLYAKWQQYYTVTVNNDGNGTASASALLVAAGTEIALSATPASGYQFNNWDVVSGGAVLSSASDASATFAMPAQDVELKANFSLKARPPYAVTVTDDGRGTGTASATSAMPGDSVTLSAVPLPGFQFNHWEVVSGNITLSSAANPAASFTMPSANVAIKAVFSPDGAARYNVTVTDDGRGEASADVTSAAAGDIVTLSAVPAPGYQFDYWEVVSGNVSLSDAANPATSFTMPSANVVLIAHFKALPSTYTVYISTDGNGTAGLSHAGGSVSTSSIDTASAAIAPMGGLGTVSLSVPAGTTITHTAQASSGYVFDTWECVSVVDIEMHTTSPNPTRSECWCLMPANDVYLVAHFKLASTGSGGSGSGSGSGGGASALPATGDVTGAPFLVLAVALGAAGILFAAPHRLHRRRV